MDNSPKKFYVNYFGCEKRKLDSQQIIDYFKANGYTPADSIKKADYIIFLTCAFCKKYEDFSITKMDKVFRKKKNDATFVVGGCLTSINPDRFIPYKNIIQMDTRNLAFLDSLIHPTIPIEKIPDTNITIFDGEERHNNRFNDIKTPAQIQYELAKLDYKIRIDWGCLGNCAFCVTRLGEKNLKSKAEDLILREFNHGLDQRYKSFFITGGDTGAYGIDVGSSIASLFEKIFAIPGDYQIHLHDFGVQWMHKYFDQLLPLFKANSSHLGCFSLPVQSGSNRILKLMRRPYKIEEIIQMLQHLKREVPSIQIGTHFLVGFPGETEEDFQQTIQLVQDVPFDFCNIFQYTDHLKADSRNFPEKVDEKLIKDRYDRLWKIFLEVFQDRHKIIQKNY